MQLIIVGLPINMETQEEKTVCVPEYEWKVPENYLMDVGTVYSSVSIELVRKEKETTDMRRLSEFGREWRNYLYANQDALFNDAADFKTRVELISDAHEDLVKAMLEDEPDMQQVSDCKEEIRFQREQLTDIMQEFATEYCSLSSGETVPTDEILDEICNDATDHFMYEIATDWMDWGEKTQKIWNILNGEYDYNLLALHDDLCELIMDEVYAEGSSELDIEKALDEATQERSEDQKNTVDPEKKEKPRKVLSPVL